MASQIDPTVPADGVPALKSDIRDNFAYAKEEIEFLQNVPPGGAPVASVFGRTGIVTATLGDYLASLIDNDSGVTGADVAAALDALAAILAVPGVDTRIAFQEGFPLVTVNAPGRTLVDTPNSGDYKRHLELQCTSGTVDLALPDLDSFGVPTIAGVDNSTVIPFCTLRPTSGNFACSVTTEVTDRLRSANGYGGHIADADKVFLGLGANTQFGPIYRLGTVGNLWILEGYLRDGSAKDLTFDGPGVSRTDAGDPVTLSDSRAPGGAGIGGLSEIVYATNAGASVVLNVAGFTVLGAAKEVHNLTGGDMSVTGANASSDLVISQGKVGFVRVRPDGTFVGAQ